MGKGYGQYCPMAKAVEIVGERWSLLVLREILVGGRRFNDIQRGVPLMSSALLAKRLKDLEHGGVVERIKPPGSKFHEYQLTVAGEELRPIIVGLGLWGQTWLEEHLHQSDLDAGVQMWDVRRRIDTGALPAGRTVMQFEFPDAPRAVRLWWIVIDHGEADLCYSDPGYEVDLYFSTDLMTMAKIWLGRLEIKKALRDDKLELIGDEQLAGSISSWLKLSLLAEVGKSMG